jgi:cytochrome c oxidase subunit II
VLRQKHLLLIPLALFIFFGIFISRIPSEPQAIEIICHRSYYEPDTIRVKKGDTVKISLKSADVTHGFALDEFGIANEIPPGPPTIVKFTADKTGTFEFHCVVRCGKDHLKMRGSLIVE